MPGETVERTTTKNIVVNSKKRITVGISDMKVSNDPGSFLITHSLGPCIGLIIYDPRVNAGGMLHYQLSSSKGHEERAKQNPMMFADTGIPLLFQEVERLGANRNNLQISVFGGASMLKDDQIFKIGIQNSRAAKKILWQLCVKIKHEDVGGNVSRTVGIDLETGIIQLQKEGSTIQLT